MTVLHLVKQRAAAVIGERFGPSGTFWFHRTGTRLEHLIRRRERYRAGDQAAAHVTAVSPATGPTETWLRELRVLRHVSAAHEEPPRLPAPPHVPWRKPVLPAQRLAFLPRLHSEVHPRAWAFPDTLNGALPWVGQLRELYANPICFPSSLAPDAGLLVHALVRNIRPRLVVETGSFIGLSTIWIGAALQANGDGGVIHTFDHFGPIKTMPWCDAEMPDGRLEFVADRLTRAGVAPCVVAHQGHCAAALREVAPELARAGGVQLAFLDADHSVRGVWHDLWALEPALPTGGFVLLHDTFPEHCGYDGPRHLLDHVNRYAVGRYEKVDLYLSPINYGLGLLRRIG